MGARLNGEQGEVITAWDYNPSTSTTGDMEAATKTISAVAEPALADYSGATTLTAPTTTLIQVLRICARLTVTIDSFGGGGAILNYRLKRAGTSISTGTLSTAASTGAKAVSVDVTAGTLTGAATMDVFLWVDAGTCVISECSVRVCVGSNQTTFTNPCLSIGPLTGMLESRATYWRIGSGNFQVGMNSAATWSDRTSLFFLVTAGSYSVGGYHSNPGASLPHVVNGTVYYYVGNATVATDLCFYDGGSFRYRRIAS